MKLSCQIGIGKCEICFVQVLASLSTRFINRIDSLSPARAKSEWMQPVGERVSKVN